MIRTLPSNILRFIVLVFVQVFLLKNIGYYNIAVPFLYILFLLKLPFDTPGGLLYLLAFATGITIDAFYDTPGMHAAACIFLVLVRILLIKITVQRQEMENDDAPSLSLMGFKWFLIYTVILTFAHHLLLFILEVFKFSDFLFTLSRVIFSSLFTVFLILITESLFSQKKSR